MAETTTRTCPFCKTPELCREDDLAIILKVSRRTLDTHGGDVTSVSLQHSLTPGQNATRDVGEFFRCLECGFVAIFSPR